MLGKKTLTGRFLLVSSKRNDFVFHAANVKQFNEMVAGGGQHPVAVAIPLQVHHGVFVTVATKKIQIIMPILKKQNDLQC